MIQKVSLISLICLLLILAFAFWVRFPTFHLPHDNGDQLFYLGLAMQLDNYGFSRYTLRGIDLQQGGDEQGNIFLLGLFPAQNEQGNLLRDLAEGGVTYYDEPLFHRSYGFAYALMFSHRIFARSKPYLTLATSGRDAQHRVYSLHAKKTWPMQFYAAVVPFLFSLFFILAVYFLARRFFGEKTALISAFLISIAPVEILCSQKVWADTLLSFLVVLTVLFFFQAKEKQNLIFAFLSGLACAAAILVKQSGGFIVIVLLIFHFWQNKAEILKLKKLKLVILDKYLWVFGLAVFLGIWHWFYAVAKTYGHPLYSPSQPGIQEQAEWFMTLSQRPRFLYLASIPYLVPVFALGYFTILAGPFIRGFIDGKKAFLIIWFLTFLGLLIYMSTKENRYILPAYPALAMLSADLLEKLGNFVNNKCKKYSGDILILALLLACAFWSVPIGLKHALSNVALILQPF